MKTLIRHETKYDYTKPVFLEPHVLQLYPRNGNGIRLLNHRIEIDPEPAGRALCIDYHGNQYHHVWFRGTTDKLHIAVESEVERYPYDPLNFLIYPFENSILPVTYSAEVQPLAAAHLARCATTVQVTAFATSVAQEVESDTTAFLTALAQRIHRMCERENRPDGPAFPPQKTLKELRGSCRDLTVMFMDACRAVGLAARFVSGYLLDGTPDEQRELHAWAEVYLPGAGWRAFDPSTGNAVGNDHVALAAGRVSALSAPVFGSYRGTGVRSTLTANISIETESLVC